MNDSGSGKSHAGPLNGWRAIAGYLGRNQSTGKRWAADSGLPVHRPKGSQGGKGVPVYAFAEELDAWLRGRGSRRLDEAGDQHNQDPPSAPTSREPAGARSGLATLLPKPGTWVWAGFLALACVAVMGAAAATGWWQYGTSPAGSAAAVSVSEEARDLYHRGQFHLGLRTADGIRHAIGLFAQALADEPGFVDASAGLAQAYNLASQYGVMPASESYPRALAAARQALKTSPDHPAALAALAFNTFYWLRDFPRSYDLFERALALDPDNADVHHWYALAVLHDRRFDIALREIEAAQSLSPTSVSILANKALILHHAGRSGEALAILEPLAEAQPRLLSPASYLATIYLDMGRDADFIRTYRQAAEIVDNGARLAIADAAASALAEGGRGAMLAAILEAQRQQHAGGHERAFKLAITAGYMEEVDLAVDYLELAVQRDEPDVLGIMLEVPGAVRGGSPRYDALVAEIGFNTP